MPEDRLERFMGLVYSLTEPFGVTDIPEVYHYVELLGQSIERHIVESKYSGTTQNRSVVDRRKFISIFKNRYLHLTDLEYSRGITGIDGKLINQLGKVLAENGFEIDEYLTWLFDVFLSENTKFCPPTIKFSCSNFVVEKFLYDHRDQIKQRREQKIREKASLDLIARSRVLIRFYADDEGERKKIIDMLKGYRDGSIMLERMREIVEEQERVTREAQQAKVASGQGGDDGTD